MDCICLKRKHRNKREQKKFRPLTPHVSPSHSQPSTLGHLPKVNSTGIWTQGNPHMYTGGPSPAYYYGRPHGSSKHRIEQPLHMQRAASETRIPQPRQHLVPTRPHYGNHNTVYMIPVPGGQRIYHSQPLAPLYEVPLGHTQGMEIYDVYQFGGGGGGSRSKLLETKHSPYYYKQYEDIRVNPRLERSKSDAQDRRAPRSDFKKPQPKQGRSSSQENKNRQPSSNKDNGSSQRSIASSDKNQRVSQSMESLKGGGVQKATMEHVHGGGFINVAYSPDIRKANPAPRPTNTTIEVIRPIIENGTPGVRTSEVISQSATDSMKLLAKNKTDDQKTQPQISSIMVEKDVDKTDNSPDIGFQHYKYQGDLYAVPTKPGVTKDIEADDGNPILHRMKEMVVEKSRHSNPATPRGDSNAGIYEEVTTVKVIKTEVTESFETADNKDDAVDGLVLPDLPDLDKDQAEDLPRNKSSLPVPQSAISVVVEKVDDEHSSPAGARQKTEVSPRPSLTDMDGAGKISSAFQFLDNYLEDDDGESHIDSPPLSPGAFRAEGVVN